MSSSDSPTPTSATDPTTCSSPSSRWGCWDSSGAGWHPYPFVPWWFMVAQLPVAGIVFALEGVLPGAGDAKFMRNAGPDLLVREATAPTATSGSAGTPANAAKAEPPRREAGRRQSRNPRYRRHGRGWRRRQRRRTVSNGGGGGGDGSSLGTTTTTAAAGAAPSVVITSTPAPPTTTATTTTPTTTTTPPSPPFAGVPGGAELLRRQRCRTQCAARHPGAGGCSARLPKCPGIARRDPSAPPQLDIGPFREPVSLSRF